jgi:2-methylisocitrate lyase-like PEP mutase family enzyme
MDYVSRRAQFRELHELGTFVMPNPFDIGSTRVLEAMGFLAVATSSAGFAASLGKLDMTVTREELLAHVSALVRATRLPLSVDAEQCFPYELGGVAQTVRLLANAGAAGCSIEDWNQEAREILSIDQAAHNVSLAATVAHSEGLVLTARAENYVQGRNDLDDTILRLCAYRDAGADVVFAPGLRDVTSLARLVKEVQVPVNVLLYPGGVSVEQLAAIGVRRISVGGAFAKAAYGAVHHAAQQLVANGTLPVGGPYLDTEIAQKAFGESL